MQDVNPRVPEKNEPSLTPCLCALLRRASRAVTRLYDAELRGSGLRATQYSLLGVLCRAGEVRQGDLGETTSLDDTTLTRNLRLLKKNGWVAIRAGSDRREKWVAITDAGRDKVEQARPAWSKVQERLRRSVADGTWESLSVSLPDLTQAAGKARTGDAS